MVAWICGSGCAKRSRASQDREGSRPDARKTGLRDSNSCPTIRWRGVRFRIGQGGRRLYSHPKQRDRDHGRRASPFGPSQTSSAIRDRSAPAIASHETQALSECFATLLQKRALTPARSPRNQCDDRSRANPAADRPVRLSRAERGDLSISHSRRLAAGAEADHQQCTCLTPFLRHRSSVRTQSGSPADRRSHVATSRSGKSSRSSCG